jgi:hypothetical protein
MDEVMDNEETKTGIRKVNINTLNLRSRGAGKPKPKPSLFDNPEDRTFWKSDDKGIALEMALTKNEIRRSLKNGEMLDVKNSRTARHLDKDHISELMKYQLDLMLDIAVENEANIFVDIDGDGIVMVDFNKETEQFEFIFTKK